MTDDEEGAEVKDAFEIASVVNRITALNDTEGEGEIQSYNNRSLQQPTKLSKQEGCFVQILRPSASPPSLFSSITNHHH